MASRNRTRRVLFWIFYSFILLLFTGAGIAIGLYYGYMLDLPEVRALENYQPSILTEIYSDDGTPIGQFFLERRKLVNPGDIPRYFKLAVIAIEDKSFYDHMGIDIRRIISSAAINLWHGKVMRGASTITQQLSKLLFLTPEVSLERKIKEALLSIQIEKRYSKETIFTFYANKIYIGHGNHGIASAAEFYFNKNPQEMTLAECALLAAIIKNPGRYSPINHPDNALARRNIVLQEMYQDGYLTERDYRDALSDPIRIAAKDFDRNFCGYFLEYVRQYLQKRYTNKQIFTQGLRVYTTLNIGLQNASERAVRDGLRSYDQRKGWRGNLPNLIASGKGDLGSFRHPDWDTRPEAGAVWTGVVLDSRTDRARIGFGRYTAYLVPDQVKWRIPGKTLPYKAKPDIRDYLKRGDLAVFVIKQVDDARKVLDVELDQTPLVQGAFLALDTKTGAIRAMVGGTQWEKTKFNRATQAKRQTGSVFKPFVYTTALIQGRSPDDIIDDSPFSVEVGRTLYTPNNIDGEFEGPMSYRLALAKSRNVPAVRLACDVGITKVIQTTKRFGVTAVLRPYPSTALGANEMTLLELVSAFSVFPNDGQRAQPFIIERIEDAHGEVLEEHQKSAMNVIPPNVARQMVSMLQGVVQFGTAAKANELKVPCGGKTGTTNDYTDTWFIGFTPSLTAGAWVGMDEKKSLGSGETGSKNALPIWISFMKEYLKGRQVEQFVEPPPPEDTESEQGPLPGPPETVRRGIVEQDLD